MTQTQLVSSQVHGNHAKVQQKKKPGMLILAQAKQDEELPQMTAWLALLQREKG